MPKDEVTAASRWHLVIDGVSTATFQAVSGFDSETEVIEWRETGEKGNVVLHKVQGNLKWSNVTCKRGVTDNTALHDWRKSVEGGKPKDARKGVTLTLLDPELETVASYALKEAWPCKLKISDLDATKGTEYVVEELELAHIEMTRTK
jgi:phage tail-like protein